MAGFFKRKKKDQGESTAQADAPAAKRSLFSRPIFSRKTPVPEVDDLLAEPPPAKRGRKRKVPAAIVPKLPEPKGPPPEPYELDSDGLISAGRLKLAVGLLWQPRERKQSLNAQAKAASIEGSPLDLSAVFAGGAQVGFASKLDGIKPGTVAAATAIPREMTGDTWLGAFVLPVPSDQFQLVWWIVALRDRLVYEDRLVRNEIDARDSFLDLLEAPGWQVVVCPTTWQVENAQEVPLPLMLPKRNKGVALQVHDPVRVWAPRAAVLAIVAGAAFGGYAYYQSIEQQRLLEEQALRAAQEAQRLADLQVAPWETMPDMQSFARRCAVAMQSVLVFPPGWRMEPVRCTASPEGGVLDLSWTKESGGRAGWLLAAFLDRDLPAPALSPELTTASLSVPVPIAPHDWGDVEPMLPATMTQMLNLRFDTLSLAIPLTEMVARATPQAPGVPVTKIWNYHAIEFQTDTSLEEYIQLISDVPAVVPEFLTYDPYTSAWRLVANIYHPPLNVQG